MDHQQIELGMLCVSAGTLGFIHTIVGLDHALPFVAIGRQGKWSLKKTLWVTLFCGLGHVGGSVLIGLMVLWSGIDLLDALALENGRGSWAAWMLIGTGVVYLLLAIRRKRSDHSHSHAHSHADGVVHTHPHSHKGSHTHGHFAKRGWPIAALFVAFVLGPCEVLVPVLIVPAGTLGLGAALLVAAIFALVTIITMLTMVTVLYRGAHILNSDWLRRHGSWVTGCVVLCSGLGILLASAG